MKLKLLPFELKTRHPFTISRGTTSVRSTLIVELEQDGARGYGEATEYTFYGASRDKTRKTLERIRPQIEGVTLDDPAEFWEKMYPLIHDNLSTTLLSPASTPPSPATFPHCALDIAAHDLWGKLKNKPVWELWGLNLENNPPTDYTIGIDTIEMMVKKLKEFPGFPVYKIKMGTPEDIQIIQRLREHTDAVFRIDANCAWSVEETIQNAAAMKQLGVEFIEQPLEENNWEGMKRIYNESVLPCVADESCQVESDVQKCSGFFHGINIKLEKCGGLTPARRMIKHARELDMKVMAGCFTESSVGISAIAQLLPLLDYVDMDGALLLAEDIASGVTIDKGIVKYHGTPGCGTRLL